MRNLLREKGYYNDDSLIIEEQSSINPKIDKLLKNSSKSGNGVGRPEFIISFKNNPDNLIVIECKASISQHESKNRNLYKDYAVDGVLLYASYLKDAFNIIAIAVSGQNEREKKISTFLWLKQHYTYKGMLDKILLKSIEIENIIKQQSKPFAEEELIKKAIEYNSFLHNYSIPEVERCTLISAILIALQYTPFLNSYKYYTSNKELIEALLSACESVLKQNDLDYEKRQIIILEYSKFRNNNDFSSDIIYNKKTKKDEKNTLLRDFILSINQDILPHIDESQFDILGKFYTQFIRYAGSDKKTGLVLTPCHITDFFCDIAELSTDDIVFDPCCGTAGFLVAAMNYMLKKAGNNTDKHKKIKSSQLIGVEKRADMFSHACSNMMMRGDGKSHILYGSCFDEKNKEIIKEQKPTKGFLNPPYQDGNADEQLEFIENTLECLTKGGICVAICQMSTVVSEASKVIEVKKRLLEKHSLEAVFSMPNDLFHPINVNSCILVFKAHSTHLKNKKTFFGYFKNDGFIKQKNSGRIDKNDNWKNIKDSWLEKYINKESVAGISIINNVTAEQEWCAEAYMETDYTSLTENDFIKTIKDYVGFLFLNNYIQLATNSIFSNQNISLETANWQYFYVSDIFEILEKAKCSNASVLLTSGEDVFYIGAKKTNNGVMEKVVTVDNLISKGNSIVFIGDGQGSIGYTNYQPFDFIGSTTLTLGYNKKLNKYNAMFLVTVLDLERYRYSFGRKYGKNIVTNARIKLPTTQQGSLDWEFMENYVKSLTYSGSL
ncbi:N-6 DNA methylase [Candidatus Tisiphia endosymbiont of Hybos culiciformis]|uniref:N-6 DNA methylase n=1 Tax=Candidatus Tisiphia endosymbiont of Hybos culiciformis TaxID=3139331 RepID=UPI003CCB33E6